MGGNPVLTLWKGNKSRWIPASHDTLHTGGGQSWPSITHPQLETQTCLPTNIYLSAKTKGAAGESKDRIENNEKK